MFEAGWRKLRNVSIYDVALVVAVLMVAAAAAVDLLRL
jgi:hypothetical protein